MTYTVPRRAICLVLTVLMLLCLAARAEDTSPLLEVHFLNVGRNDGILIRFGEETVFFDGGGYHMDRVILPYLAAHQVDHIDYYIGTHAHLDHVGTAGPIFAAIPTFHIIAGYPLVIEGMLKAAHTDEEIRAIHSIPLTTVSRGDAIAIGPATLTCEGPRSFIRCYDPSDGFENDNSLIFRLTYGEITFLLTADSTTSVINGFLDEDPDFLTCNVLKSRHHNVGMHSYEFSRLKADYVIYSTSDDYRPTDYQIACCRQAGAQVLITADSNAGNILFTTDGHTLSYSTSHSMGAWSLSPDELTVMVGGEERFSKNILSRYAIIDTLHYSSSDPAIARVDPNSGRVRGVSPGDCVVTVTGYDGSQRSLRVHVVPR